MRFCPGRFLLDVFAGCGAVAKAARWEGFMALEVDIAHGYDMLSGVLVQNLVAAVKQKRVLCIMFAPPCLTFTVARCSGDPLRSSALPAGLPDLPPKKEAMVQEANRLVRNMLRLVNAAESMGIAWAIENPHSSFLWKLPRMASLAAAPGVHTVVCDQCLFGARWRKRTRFC